MQTDNPLKVFNSHKMLDVLPGAFHEKKHILKVSGKKNF